MASLQSAYRSYGGTMIDLEKRQNKTATITAAVKDIGGFVKKAATKLDEKAVEMENLEAGKQLLSEQYKGSDDNFSFREDIDMQRWGRQGGVEIDSKFYTDKQIAELGGLSKGGENIDEIIENWKRVMVGTAKGGNYKDRPELKQERREKWAEGVEEWNKKRKSSGLIQAETVHKHHGVQIDPITDDKNILIPKENRKAPGMTIKHRSKDIYRLGSKKGWDKDYLGGGLMPLPDKPPSRIEHKPGEKPTQIFDPRNRTSEGWANMLEWLRGPSEEEVGDYNEDLMELNRYKQGIN